jgi:hypothetical protein
MKTCKTSCWCLSPAGAQGSTIIFVQYREILTLRQKITSPILGPGPVQETKKLSSVEPQDLLDIFKKKLYLISIKAKKQWFGICKSSNNHIL